MSGALTMSDTNGPRTIRGELRALLAWFPGSRRFSWTQVLIVPALLAYGYHLVFTRVLTAKWEPEGLPGHLLQSENLFAVMHGAAMPILWMLYIGAFVLLARAYRTHPREAHDAIALFGSSWVYAILMSGGFVVVACVHAQIVGIPIGFGSLVHVVATLVVAYGELAVVLACLALVVRYAPFLAPALAVGVLFYAQALPVYYSTEILNLGESDFMRRLILVAPLAEVIDWMRDALLRDAPFANLLRLPRILLATTGYALVALAFRHARLERSRLALNPR